MIQFAIYVTFENLHRFGGVTTKTCTEYLHISCRNNSYYPISLTRHRSIKFVSLSCSKPTLDHFFRRYFNRWHNTVSAPQKKTRTEIPLAGKMHERRRVHRNITGRKKRKRKIPNSRVIFLCHLRGRPALQPDTVRIFSAAPPIQRRMWNALTKSGYRSRPSRLHLRDLRADLLDDPVVPSVFHFSNLVQLALARWASGARVNDHRRRSQCLHHGLTSDRLVHVRGGNPPLDAPGGRQRGHGANCCTAAKGGNFFVGEQRIVADEGGEGAVTRGLPERTLAPWRRRRRDDQVRRRRREARFCLFHVR
jgi:hypothetical protein